MDLELEMEMKVQIQIQIQEEMKIRIKILTAKVFQNRDKLKLLQVERMMGLWRLI